MSRPVCSEQGCTNVGALYYRLRDGSPVYRSKCVGCHRAQYGMRRTADRPAHDATTRRLSAEPCARCGWAEAPTDRHRLQKGRGYVAGNCVPLCPNCHRLITLGLAALAEAVQV